jgi:hypothetical protein
MKRLIHLVQRLGYYIPLVVTGNALACIGYGLLSMLTPDYPIAKRVGFQVLVGLGIGTSISMVSPLFVPH